MKLNVEALLKVRKQILAEPGAFAMSETYALRDEPIWPDIEWSERGECGAVMCFAGLVCWNNGINKPGNLIGQVNEILGLERDPWLFFTCDWPDQLKSRWDAETTIVGRAKIGAEAIDRFIAEHASPSPRSHS